MTAGYTANSYASTANLYKNQQVMTATPGELTMLLYNGALKFANEAKKAMQEKEYEKAHAVNLKAQKIISELSLTLNREYEISENWARLYEYTNYCLIQANIKRDVAKMDEAIKMIREFRGMWLDVMQQTKGQ